MRWLQFCNRTSGSNPLCMWACKHSKIQVSWKLEAQMFIIVAVFVTLNWKQPPYLLSFTHFYLNCDRHILHVKPGHLYLNEHKIPFDNFNGR
jgi:hypothetical protein